MALLMLAKEEYRRGFRKPNWGFPAAMRALLSREMTPLHTGVLQRDGEVRVSRDGCRAQAPRVVPGACAITNGHTAVVDHNLVVGSNGRQVWVATAPEEDTTTVQVSVGMCVWDCKVPAPLTCG